MRMIIVTLLLLVLCAGCATGPYVRSDIFVDPDNITAIFVMPVVTEVTLDSESSMSHAKLKRRLDVSRGKIRDILTSELSRRGYTVTGFSKPYHELSTKEPSENAVRLATRAYVGSQYAGDPVNEENLAVIVETIRQITTEGGEMKVKQPSSSVVQPTLDAKAAYSRETDTVLFLFIKSRVAPRKMFGRVSDKSTIFIRAKLVSIKEETVVFSHVQKVNERDILHNRSLERSLSEVIAHLPVKTN